jgi:hypothetical protein
LRITQHGRIIMRKNIISSIVILAALFFLTGCGASHSNYRGQENWGAVLGYTTKDLRGMSQAQFQEAYAKSKAAADANADWARSEALWTTSSKKSGKTVFGSIVNVFEKTVVGIASDAGNQTRRGVRDIIRN